MKYTIHCIRTISESVEVEADSLADAFEAFEEREDVADLCHGCSGSEFSGDDFSRSLDGSLAAERVEDSTGTVVWTAES